MPFSTPPPTADPPTGVTYDWLTISVLVIFGAISAVWAIWMFGMFWAAWNQPEVAIRPHASAMAPGSQSRRLLKSSSETQEMFRDEASERGERGRGTAREDEFGLGPSSSSFLSFKNGGETSHAYYGSLGVDLSTQLFNIETVLRDELGALNGKLENFVQDLRAARVFEQTVQRNHGCERQHDRYRDMVRAYMPTCCYDAPPPPPPDASNQPTATIPRGTARCDFGPYVPNSRGQQQQHSLRGENPPPGYVYRDSQGRPTFAFGYEDSDSTRNTYAYYEQTNHVGHRGDASPLPSPSHSPSLSPSPPVTRNNTRYQRGSGTRSDEEARETERERMRRARRAGTRMRRGEVLFEMDEEMLIQRDLEEERERAKAGECGSASQQDREWESEARGSIRGGGNMSGGNVGARDGEFGYLGIW